MQEAQLLLAELVRDPPMVGMRTVRLVFALVVASGLWVVVARSWTIVPATLALIVSGLVWLRVDQRIEGDVLYEFDRAHGVTQADLLVPIVVAAAAGLRLARWWLRRRRG